VQRLHDSIDAVTEKTVGSRESHARSFRKSRAVRRVSAESAWKAQKTRGRRTRGRGARAPEARAAVNDLHGKNAPRRRNAPGKNALSLPGRAASPALFGRFARPAVAGMCVAPATRWSTLQRRKMP
jgi:hypothetical protein